MDGEAAGTPTSTYGEQQRRLQSSLEIITSDVFAVTRLPSDACAADLTGDGVDDLVVGGAFGTLTFFDGAAGRGDDL